MTDVKMWIKIPLLPGDIQNPVRKIKRIRTITCLIFASLVSDDATVRQLVEAGADIEVTDSRGSLDEIYSALHYACASDVDADAKVTYLMQHDASQQTAAGGLEQTVPGPEFYSKSLRLAAWLNQADRVRALIDDHGVSVNATDHRNRTALHLSALEGHVETVKLLLNHPECGVNAAYKYGRTPLDDAVKAGHVETVKLLLGHPECRVNTADRDDCTPLHDAAKAGNVETVKLLLSHPECRVNAIGYWGSTPLRDAAEAGNVETVKLLLSHPEYQLNLFDDLSQTLDWARQSGLYDIAALVEDKSKGNLRQRL